MFFGGDDDVYNSNEVSFKVVEISKLTIEKGEILVIKLDEEDLYQDFVNQLSASLLKANPELKDKVIVISKSVDLTKIKLNAIKGHDLYND